MKYPKLLLVSSKGIGFGLLFVYWMKTSEITGFFLILMLGILLGLRFRVPRFLPLILVDAILLASFHQYVELVLMVLSELYYVVCEKEYQHGLKRRDVEAHKYYEMEQLQADLLVAGAQIERMTVVSERARIAAEIHDNAGHEIIGAYMSFQTIRELLDEADEETLELYQMALNRLESGVSKMREAVHNVSPVTVLGIRSLQETCDRFPNFEVDFHSFGDFSLVPIYGWNLLDSCLNESLTNVARHSNATKVTVEVDATPNMARICIENDGIKPNNKGGGMGLRNLRHRAAAVGGNVSVDVTDIYRLVCVVPFESEEKR